MSYYFITDKFKSEISHNLINKIFKKLNSSDKLFLLDRLARLVDVIAVKFNFQLSKRDEYEHQLRQNNYRDLNGLLLMLLPFINDNSCDQRCNNKLKSELVNLADLYTMKRDANASNANNNINQTAPDYLYTNIQYGRAERIANPESEKSKSKLNDDYYQIHQKTIAKEITFSLDHLSHNYILLLDTILHINHRLFVNWVDILPMPVSTYVKSEAYVKTNDNITNGKLKHWEVAKLITMPDSDFLATYNESQGLDPGEIYNIITNHLYYSIKNIKWFIFEIIINGQIYNLMHIFNKIIDLSNCSNNNKNWNMLSSHDRDTFSHQLDAFINTFNKGSNNDNQIPSEIIKYIAKAFIMSLYRDPIYANRAIKDGFVKPEMYIDQASNKTKYKIDQSMNSLLGKAPLVYDFLQHSFSKFRTTWYASFFYKFDQAQNIYIFESDKDNHILDINKNNTNTFTLKNVYNFAKSLCHRVSGNKYMPMNQFWQSCNSMEKSTIIERLNYTANQSGNKWFNISGYIRNILKIPDDQIRQVNTQIYQNIMLSLAWLVFNVLSQSGLLSEFRPNYNLTDSQYLPKDEELKNKKRLEIIKTNYKFKYENEHLFDAHYFLNNIAYKHMTVDVKDETKTITYFDAILNDKNGGGGWVHMYALDWISQIAFFHHYLNNRVIYVTGGTGVGKSTQIPKLLLYALKLIDYKPSGKIICSQPRIPPTIRNATTISQQLGAPIIKYNKQINDNIRTSNYYIQYEYKGDSHTDKQSHLTLDIVTDGKLETKIRANKLLKRGTSTDNLYDIVIVDEAHEHNKNMDMILTLMKYALYFNNDIKLVIISATMDSDEPKYRSYYREINDNRMFPLNVELAEYGLDRINVDRRLHISPPGETTQYDIKEIYNNNIQQEQTNAKIVDIVMKILACPVDNCGNGDILIFAPGEREINDLMAILIQSTPNNVLILPYYSKMNDEFRKLVESIDRTLIAFTYSRNVSLFKSLDDPAITRVPAGTYTRAIIIATNIAEASITIKSLKYVIDTGTEKSDYYDWENDESVLNTDLISESSRVQRKGRVGRVGSGTVYYLYEKDTMLNNKIKYKIAVQDTKMGLFDSLYIPNANIQYFTNDSNPNNILNKAKYTQSNLINLYIDKLDRMIEKQYMINDSTGTKTYYDYVGNMAHYDYQYDNINGIPYPYYTTGFDLETLLDPDGRFYIIHPNELDMRRNILGQIIFVKKSEFIYDKAKSKYYSRKLLSFVNSLKQMYFVVGDHDNNIVYKTVFGIEMNKLMNQIQYQDLLPNYYISYIYSRVYDCSDSILKLMAMHMVCQSVKNMVRSEKVDDKPVYKTADALALYSNQYGDSFALLNIANKIIDLFARIGQRDHRTSNASKYQNAIRNQIEKNKGYFIANDYSKLNSRQLNIFMKLLNSNSLSMSPTLTSDEERKFMIDDQYIHEYRAYIDQITETHHDSIDNWAKISYLDTNNITRFYKKYIEIAHIFAKAENKIYDMDIDNIDNSNQEINIPLLVSHTPKLFNNLPNHMKPVVSLMHGFPTKIVRQLEMINGTTYYVNLLKPNISTVYQLKDMTFIKQSSMLPNLLYIKKVNADPAMPNNLYDTIRFIDNVPIDLIIRAFPYLSSQAQSKLYVNDEQSKIIDNFFKDKTNKRAHIEFLTEYANVVRSIRADIANNVVRTQIDSLAVLDDSKEIKDMIKKSYNFV